MKRPWQIWTLFAIGLAIVLPAMGWLTLKALELDRAEAEARRKEAIARRLAEEQELIGSALWRMDWALTPLVAQEAARPYYVYQPFYAAPDGSGGKGKTPSRGKGVKGTLRQVPSPLLVQPSEYVLLHFQLDAEGKWTSPQNPSGPLADLAVSNGAAPDNIRRSADRLALLEKAIDRNQLLTMLPESSLPALDISPYPWASNLTLNYNRDAQTSDQQVIVNDLGLQQVKQQLQEVQDAQQEAQPLQLPPQIDNGAQQPDPFDPQPNVPNQPGGQAGQAAEAPNPPPQFANNNADGRNSSQQQFLRGGNEFQRRNRAAQNYGLSQIVQQRTNTAFPLPLPSASAVKEGVNRPLWLDGHLLLARRVWCDDGVEIQGCWLDWKKIKAMLIAEVQDLLPEFDLVPVTSQDKDVQISRMLATLPVMLVTPQAVASLPTPARFSTIKISLLVAWGCLLLATGAAAILLQGVMTLSERRGAFVSAVTHELRTPLTTFRMYAEMLSGGMVNEPAQQQQYLDTLRVESDRLSHLVENVLAYARLERGKPGKRRVRLQVADLLDRVQSRLLDRAGQAEMNLQIETDQDAMNRAVHTDPGAVEQILFNLVDNACKYAAAAEDKRIHLQIALAGQEIAFRVRDHGPGISSQAANKLFRPFSKSVHEAADTAPGVGLGLALSRRLAAALGGRLELQNSGGVGAAFVLSLPMEPEATKKGR